MPAPARRFAFSVRAGRAGRTGMGMNLEGDEHDPYEQLMDAIGRGDAFPATVRVGACVIVE